MDLGSMAALAKAEDQRFLLTIGYQAGPDPKIKRGADGYRDYFGPDELEKAAWSLLRSGAPTCGLFHQDGTEGAADIVESSIWRAEDPWVLQAVDGTRVEVRKGDWLVGLLCDPTAWRLYKSGRIAGVSPQGYAKRRRPGSQVAKEFVMAKSVAVPEGDEDEMTELYDAQVPRIDLVGKGANGMPFLIAKSADGGGGLFDPAYVRELIAKSEPAAEAPRAGETVTMSGSPAAIAALIHGAPLRKAMPAAEPDDDDVAKAEASTQSMNDRPDSDFAYVEGGGTKDESGKTVPRSLRHFPIYDAAHVRNALSRAPQSPFGDKAMPKIRSAATKFGIDVSKEIDMAVATGEIDDGIDGMDPTVVLAEPDDEAPGDSAEPGSPAWEAIDAATARKWTAIAVRLRNALGVMADRELLEAATADPDDAETAFDLKDAECCLDCVIDTLAGFAVEEQAEADLCGEAMEQIGKAMAGFDPAPLELIEGLAPLAKAGRVLSSANEAAIRGAVESLQKVLASLPQAPTATDEEGGRAVAKTANEESDMPTPTLTEDVTAASGQEPALGAKTPVPKPVAGTAVTDMAKADGDASKPDMVAVYDQDGNLVGVVDPTDITRIATAKAPTGNADDSAAPADGDGAQDAPPVDMTPAPAASVGTPADAVPADDDSVAKAAENRTTEDPQDVLKGSVAQLVKAALEEQGAQQGELIKSLEDRNRRLEERNEELGSLAKSLEERLTRVENQPAVMAIASNGAVPPAHLLRGQDHGARVDVTKAEQLRTAFKASDDARQQKVLSENLNELAIEKLREIHAAGPR